MKRFCIAIVIFGIAVLTFLFSVRTVSADSLVQTYLDSSLGYRHDELDWNIAFNNSGGSPNILSELTWKDLEIAQLKIDGQLEIENVKFKNSTTVLKGSLAFGKILAGENQDSDYAGDNRTLEWSRSNNAADDGRTFDLSAALGFKQNILPGRFSLTPLVGLSCHRQELTMSDGQQTLSNAAHYSLLPGSDPVSGPLPVGPFNGLDSSYDATWYGFWVGMDFDFAPSENWQLTAGGEYHWADYEGKADWNLRGDFKHPLSFQHDARGHGIVTNLSVTRNLTDHWTLLFSGNYQVWKTNPGSDRVFMADDTVAFTRLNEVNWKSYTVAAGVRYRF